MNSSTSPELFYLVLTAALTGILWMGYIVNRIKENGLLPALGTPKEDRPPQANWANRMLRAHSNAVENLVVFASLVLALQLNQATNEVTAMAAMVYFYARLSHAIIYTVGIIGLRTLAFFVGFVCQAVLFMQCIG